MTALRIQQNVDLCCDGNGLTQRPNAFERTFAFDVVAVGLGAGCKLVNVSSSKLRRGCPAAMVRWFTYLSAVPKWQDMQSLARACGSSDGKRP